MRTKLNAFPADDADYNQNLRNLRKITPVDGAEKIQISEICGKL